MGVLVDDGEGAAEHKGARTHLLVVSDGREVARGGPATHAGGVTHGCSIGGASRRQTRLGKGAVRFRKGQGGFGGGGGLCAEL